MCRRGRLHPLKLKLHHKRPSNWKVLETLNTFIKCVEAFKLINNVAHLLQEAAVQLELELVVHQVVLACECIFDLPFFSQIILSALCFIS